MTMEKVLKVSLSILALATMLVSGVMGYATLQADVKENSEDIAAAKKYNEKVDKYMMEQVAINATQAANYTNIKELLETINKNIKAGGD